MVVNNRRLVNGNVRVHLCSEFRFFTQNPVSRKRATKLLKRFVHLQHVCNRILEVVVWTTDFDAAHSDYDPPEMQRYSAMAEIVHTIYQGTVKSAMINYCSNTSPP
jgi:hypothetical protein